jgi:sec-independent protein translocase protein TatA
MIAEIFSPDILIVLVVIALLFGGSQLPKLARSLGSAKGEFEKGMKEGEQKAAAEKAEKAQKEAAEKAAAADDDA